jgi:hypothetical protein
MEFSNFLVFEPLAPVHFIDKILPKLDNQLHLNFKKLWTSVQKGVSILAVGPDLGHTHPGKMKGGAISRIRGAVPASSEIMVRGAHPTLALNFGNFQGSRTWAFGPAVNHENVAPPPSAAQELGTRGRVSHLVPETFLSRFKNLLEGPSFPGESFGAVLYSVRQGRFGQDLDQVSLKLIIFDNV